MPWLQPRKLIILAALALGSVPSTAVFAHESPTAQDDIAVLKAAREMAAAATNLWASLSPEQQKQMGFEFKDDERLNWHFIPRPRKGLPWKDMTPAQRALGQAMLSSGLGQHGFAKAETIMSLEQVLHEMEQGKGQFKRDSELYYFSVFGKPGTDSNEPWGWRVEGHHLSLNFTIAGGKGVAAGPTFMGSNPGKIKEGPRAGLRVLAEEEDMGRALVKALSEEQRKKAIVMAEAPKDIITVAERKVKPLEPLGITAADLKPEQKEQLVALVKEYANRLRPELANQDLAKIEKASFDKVGFAWAGGLEPGQPHYYRIQGPTFLIEYDDTQNNANHIHTVWRDFDNDFGEDLLKKHYQQEPHP